MKLPGKQNLFQDDKVNLLMLTIAALIVILPIFLRGIPDGYDLPHHLQCAETFVEAFKNGEFYPSWSLSRNYGYGGLELRMYPPISHYVLALFKLATGNWQLAVFASYSFWCILGCLGIYFWSREFVAPPAALFAAVLFAIIPYRINEIYQTFLYAEFAGGSILPFCFAFLTRILKPASEPPGRRRFLSLDTLGLTVALAALILTHLPLTLIGIIGLGVYFLSQTRWSFPKSLNDAVQISIAGILSLAATSFFWMKVVQERFMMAKTSVYEEVVINYDFNFLLTFLQTYDGVSYEVSFIPFFYDLVLLLTVLSVLPMALIGLSKEYNAEKSVWRGVWLTFVFSIFIATVLSKPLWDHLPLLFEVQFPWRWLNIVSVLAPILAAGGFSTCRQWSKNEKQRSSSILIFGLILVSLTLSLSWAVSTGKYIAPDHSEAHAAKAITEEGFKFWWPIWTRENFNQISSEKVLAPGRQITVTEWTALDRRFSIEAGAPQNVRVALFYHPNWRVFIDHQPVPANPDSTGAITFAVPAEKSDITIQFTETNEVLAGRKISMAAWTVLVFLFLTTLAAYQRKSR